MNIMKSDDSEVFQILSLDGGGIKGLFSAAVLAALEDDLNINITDHFDLITGTSTGGIIALGLGLGLRPAQIVDFYAREGPSIFKNCLGLRNVRHWFYRKYPQQNLRRAIENTEGFKGKILGDATKRLVIPSYNLGEDDVYLFKTPHHTRLKRDWKEPVWKVALATSAAPTFFPACTDVGAARLIDGGIWANNPILVGITEAVSLLDVPMDKIRVCSLGTSDEVTWRPQSLTHGGKLAWASSVVSVIMRGQSLGAHKQALHLLGSDKISRLDPKVPKGLLFLDKVDVSTLMGKASHESRIFAPEFETRFQSHTAKPYVPIYRESTKGESP